MYTQTVDEQELKATDLGDIKCAMNYHIKNGNFDTAQLIYETLTDRERQLLGLNVAFFARKS